jgi:[protein-PII] uridylyltransferase
MATPAIAGTGLRATLDETLAALPDMVSAPGSGGPACRQIADAYDRAIAARFAQATAGISAPLALVATGGWARRELAPYSDIDFIILHDRDEAVAKQVADRLLYPLWDEKLAIGHALREARAAARLARDDLATATALLDARHIAGERRLSTELVRATLGVLAPGGNANGFISAVAAEKKGRHDRFGASLYLLEPNLKQGIGALRDLSTALWAAQVRWHPPRPGVDPETAEQLIANLVTMGHLTRRQGDVLSGARDFMLRIRILVQLQAKRRFDQLTFEVQEAIAPALYPDARPHEGDIRSAVAPAVEALMRDYYLHARGVVQLADLLLESARVPARRKPRIAQIDASFITFNGELALKDPNLFAERPSEMLRLFRVAVAHELAVYGHTRELVAETIARDPRPLASDRRAHQLFLEALVDVRDAAQPSAMETMHQLGILNALMPEWAPCTCRVQHDLYHVYTVDQHQLYALAMQKRLARGELADEHPFAVELWKQVRRPAALLLGTLLHDVGKPLGKGHAEKGAVVAGAVARRLGMTDDEVDVTEFLVRQHLTMAHISQRRDLTDPDVIARFAERVGSEDRLTKLYLLTLCDTAMTNPDNLNAWKAGLLRELVIRAGRFFRGEHLRGEAADADPEGREQRDKIVQLAVAGGALDDKLARALVDGIDPGLTTQLTARQAARHVRLVAAALHKQPPVGLEVHCFPMRGHSEVSIVAPDAPGVLAAIAGALTANRVDVLGAFLGHIDLPSAGAAPSVARRLVMDTFYVRDLKGEAIPEDDARWSRLASDLRELLANAPAPGAVEKLIAKRRPRSGMPRRRTPGVITEIRLHDDSSQATIVEVATQDRVGVLHAITQTLADLGLDISLAKVATEGEKVADAFYVHRSGQRITDPAERALLIARLGEALEAPRLSRG